MIRNEIYQELQEKLELIEDEIADMIKPDLAYIEGFIDGLTFINDKEVE